MDKIKTNEVGCAGEDWIQKACDKDKTVTSREFGNEPLGYTKDRELLGQLSESLVLKASMKCYDAMCC